MKSIKFIAAVTAAVSLFAAGAASAAPAAAATAAATAAAAANATFAATRLNVPTVTIGNPQARTRDEVKAEAVEFVANYKTALAIQLELAKN